MPIRGGFRGCNANCDLPPPLEVSTSPSSVQLDKSTEMSLKKGLMALEPITGTNKPPPGWSTSSASNSGACPTQKLESPVKERAPARTSAEASAEELTEISKKASAEPATFSMLPENVLERVFHEVGLQPLTVQEITI